MKLQTKGLVLGILTASMMSSAAMAEDWEGEAKDAWIDGKLEGSYLLNSELDGFKIGTEVENGTVTLTGNVPSDAHKQLAEEIAQNLDGVTAVNNNLAVAETGDEYDDNDRNFSSRFYDMTTTVGLKSNFAVNDELEAHEINIDTVEGVVTLEGEVDSQAEAMLAEEIASSYDHVSRVQNNLRVTADN
ncbi:MAG TPA: BON domain-containing protein [Pseudomonadales bacterium]